MPSGRKTCDIRICPLLLPKFDHFFSGLHFSPIFYESSSITFLDILLTVNGHETVSPPTCSGGNSVIENVIACRLILGRWAVTITRKAVTSVSVIILRRCITSWR